MSSICHKLHEFANTLLIHSFPFDEDRIPENGIYILFEKGEQAHHTNRIVRIGTHTGQHQLKSRLFQHFLLKNKDRSIFRKNIGRCFLNEKGNSYLKIWDMDFTTSEMKKKKANYVDPAYQQSIEKRISKYIQSMFTFAVLEINGKDDRLYFESRLISTVSLCEDCLPSPNWLGLQSPKEKIRESGLWQVNELYKAPLSDGGFQQLRRYTAKCLD